MRLLHLIGGSWSGIRLESAAHPIHSTVGWLALGRRSLLLAGWENEDVRPAEPALRRFPVRSDSRTRDD
jgi:hypothetical protein